MTTSTSPAPEIAGSGRHPRSDDSGAVVSFPSGARVSVIGQLELDTAGDGVRPVRLPRRAFSQFPPAGEILRAVVTQPSGVRIRTRTTATRITLRARCFQVKIADLLVPTNCFVATVDGRTHARVPTPIDGTIHLTLDGTTATVEESRDSSLVEVSVPPGEKTVEIWLPQSVQVDLLDIHADHPLHPAASDRPVWIHHGSSISHCAEAGEPTSAWPVVAAHDADLDVINLGFGGQCMLDPFVADAIAATPAQVISLKVGINIVGARSMDQRTFVPALHGFLDRIRLGHAQTPIILSSAILWPGSEQTPGPSTVEFNPDGTYRCSANGDPTDIATGALTLATSRDHVRHVAQVRAAAGEPIHYLDGRQLYGEPDAAHIALPDGLHPNATIYREMGHRFAALAFGPDGLVPRRLLHNSPPQLNHSEPSSLSNLHDPHQLTLTDG